MDTQHSTFPRWVLVLAGLLVLAAGTEAYAAPQQISAYSRSMAERGGRLITCSSFFSVLTSTPQAEAQENFAHASELFTAVAALHMTAAAGEAFTNGEINKLREHAFAELEKVHRSGGGAAANLPYILSGCVAWHSALVSFVREVGEPALRAADGNPAAQRLLLARLREPSEEQIQASQVQLGPSAASVVQDAFRRWALQGYNTPGKTMEELRRKIQPR